MHLVFCSENTGYANGNNAGIKESVEICPEIEAFLIMNPDIDIDDPTILIELYGYIIGHDNVGAITAKTIFNGKYNEPNECAWRFMTRRYMKFGDTLTGKYLARSLKYKTLTPDDGEIATVDVVQGCFFMIRRDIFERIDLFDPNTFLYGEESILAKKLQRIGCKNAVHTGFYIHHNHREKDKRLIKYENKLFDMKCFYYSRKYYIKQYSDEGRLFSMIAITFLNLDYYLKRLMLLGKKMGIK